MGSDNQSVCINKLKELSLLKELSYFVKERRKVKAKYYSYKKIHLLLSKLNYIIIKRAIKTFIIFCHVMRTVKFFQTRSIDLDRPTPKSTLMSSFFALFFLCVSSSFNFASCHELPFYSLSKFLTYSLSSAAD